MTLAELSERFRIPIDLLDAAGVRHANDAEVRELLGVHGRTGQDLSGIVFPYRNPCDGRVHSHRVRFDTPTADGQKYLSEQGCRTLFFPPISGRELTDTSILVVIVEAEKSALALTGLYARYRRTMLAIAVGGVYGWKRNAGIELTPDGARESVTGPSPSFDWVVWLGRKVIIAFDSNVAGRRDLEKACFALATELAKRGAKVFIASVPKRDGVNGPDDLIALQGDDAMIDLLDSPVAAELDVIRLRCGELPDAVDQVEEILLNHADRFRIFQRAGELVRAISLPEPRKGGGLQRSKGTVQLTHSEVWP